MPDQDKILRVILRYTSDEAAVKKVTDEIKAIEAAEKKATIEAEVFRKKLENIKNTAEKLGSISTMITGIGAVLAGPFILAAKNYVEKVGQSEQISRRWLAATEKISKAQMEIGRIATTSILPMLEKVASIAEAAAEFAQKHPGVVEAAVKIGMAMAAVGAIGLAVSKGIRLVADIKFLAATAQQLLAGKMMQDAASKQIAAASGMSRASLGRGVGGLGAVGMGVGLVAGGAVAGGLAYEGLRSAGVAKGASLGQFAAVAGAGAGYMLPGGSEKRALEWFKAVGQWAGVIAQNAGKTKSALDGLSQSIANVGQRSTTTRAKTRTLGGDEVVLPAGGMRIGWKGFSKRGMAARKGGRQQAQSAQAQQQAGAARAAQERERLQAMIEAKQVELQAEFDYQNQRTKIIRNFQREALLAEQQQSLEIKRLKEDANLRMTDAAQKRDAISFLQEWRSSKIQQSRAEEDYKIQRDARRAQMQAQIKDLEEFTKQEGIIRKTGYKNLLADATEFTGRLGGLLTGNLNVLYELLK